MANHADCGRIRRGPNQTLPPESALGTGEERDQNMDTERAQRFLEAAQEEYEACVRHHAQQCADSQRAIEEALLEELVSWMLRWPGATTWKLHQCFAAEEALLSLAARLGVTDDTKAFRERARQRCLARRAEGGAAR